MGCYVGIDVGAVSVKAAVLADGSTAERLAGRADDSPLRRLADAPGGRSLWIAEYRRTRGRPVEAA